MKYWETKWRRERKINVINNCCEIKNRNKNKQTLNFVWRNSFWMGWFLFSENWAFLAKMINNNNPNPNLSSMIDRWIQLFVNEINVMFLWWTEFSFSTNDISCNCFAILSITLMRAPLILWRAGEEKKKLSIQNRALFEIELFHHIIRKKRKEKKIRKKKDKND